MCTGSSYGRPSPTYSSSLWALCFRAAHESRHDGPSLVRAGLNTTLCVYFICVCLFVCRACDGRLEAFVMCASCEVVGAGLATRLCVYVPPTSRQVMRLVCVCMYLPLPARSCNSFLCVCTSHFPSDHATCLCVYVPANRLCVYVPPISRQIMQLVCVCMYLPLPVRSCNSFVCVCTSHCPLGHATRLCVYVPATILCVMYLPLSVRSCNLFVCVCTSHYLSGHATRLCVYVPPTTCQVMHLWQL